MTDGTKGLGASLTGSVVVDSELVSRTEFERTEMYVDWARPQDMGRFARA